MEANKVPDSPNGTYTLPPSYKVANGDTADASQHNPPFEDLAQAVSDRLHRDGRTSWTGNQNANGFKVTGLADATNPGDAVRLSQASGFGVPVGSVIDYAGATPPDGWLICNGQAVSRTSFPALFSAIGTTHGIGNGSTTFNVPDLRGRVVAGLDNMGGSNANRLGGEIASTTLGSAGGSKEHALTVAQMPSHRHSGTTSTDGAHTHTIRTGTGSGGRNDRVSRSAPEDVAIQDGGTIQSAGNHNHTFNTNYQGSGAAHPNVQPTMVMNKIIKAR